MIKSENKMCELQDLLDSDDELPTTYNEVPETPAYLNDSRFDAIQFSWLNRGQARKCPKKKEAIVAPITLSAETDEEQSTLESSPELCQNVTSSAQPLLAPFTYHEEYSIQYLRKTHCNENKDGDKFQLSRNRTLMKKGILNEQDILCMKTFAALTSDEAALLWFIDFLIYKDLQADYKFLTSCLVGHQMDQEGSNSPTMDFPEISNNYFDLVLT